MAVGDASAIYRRPGELVGQLDSFEIGWSGVKDGPTSWADIDQTRARLETARPPPVVEKCRWRSNRYPLSVSIV